MNNEIESKRKDILQYFDSNAIIPESDNFSLAVHGIFYYEIDQFKQSDKTRNWIITRVRIGDIEKQEFFFEYLTDNDNPCSVWMYRNSNDYLLLPEIQGGQSIFDVSQKTLYSFYSKEDPFIWTRIMVSPDSMKLAVEGCYWGYPYELVVYDCSDLLNLPYPSIFRKQIGTDYTLGEWIDTHWLTLINTKGDSLTINIGN